MNKVIKIEDYPCGSGKTTRMIETGWAASVPRFNHDCWQRIDMIVTVRWDL